MLNEKDLLAINKRFSNGHVINESSLKFICAYIKNSRSWIKSLASLTRAILIDHIFEDGNKRTAAAVIAYYFEDKGYNYSMDLINKMIVNILKKNISIIEDIERLIENVIKSSIAED